MTLKASAVIRLRFPSEKEAKIIREALKPETEVSLTHRSKVQVQREGKDLTLIFEARDTAALRASMSSYLHWLKLLTNVYNVLTSL